MTKSVDKRVVEMGFENKSFEKNIKESSTSLRDFNSALEKTGGAGSAAAGLGKIAQGVAGKFGVLGTIATGALLRIGSEAVATGVRLAKSLTLDQITAGFQEYELKINSIKTILAGGRTKEGLPVTLEMVNEQLAELNEYADKTIYSFKDMTSNIGKFTNAGVDLELAVQSMKGISNVAAVSGANTQEASRAMYNFAQALSAGYVKFIDWKSIENANMATVEFKEQLLESGVAAGTLEKTAEGMYRVLTGGSEMIISPTKEFNQSLQDQWMTTEVLTSTLEKYADETTEIGAKATEAATKVRTFGQLMDTVKEAIGSGWGVTFENIFGDYDEATELWSSVSKEIDKLVSNSSDARNQILSDWKKFGGRDAIIRGLGDAWDAFKTVLLTVRVAWRETFGTLNKFKLTNISHDIRLFLKNLKPTNEQIVSLTKIFKGFFSALSLAWRFVSSIFKGFANGIKLIADSFGGGGKGILHYLGKLGDIFTNLKQWADEGKIFSKVSEGIAKGIGWIALQIGNLISAVKDGKIFGRIKDFFKSINIKLPKFEGLKNLGEGIASIFSSIGDKSGTVKTNVFEKVGGALGKFVDFVKRTFGPGIERFKDLMAEVMPKIKKFFGENFNFEGFVSAITKIGTLFIAGGFFANIGKFIRSFSKIGDEAGGFIKGLTKDITSLGGVKGILGSFQDVLKSYQSQLNSKKLLTIAGAIALLVGSLVIITLVDQTKLLNGVAVITGLVANLSGAMVALDKSKGGGLKGAGSMLLLAGAVLILVGALTMLKNVDPETIVALTFIIAELVAANYILGQMKGNMGKASANLIAMAAALDLISIAVLILGKMDPEALKQGLIGVSVLMGELLIFSVVLGQLGGNAAGMIAAGVAMGIMALALLSLTGVVAILAQFDPEKLKTGLMGLGGIMLIMAASLLALANPNVLLGAAAMVIMAGAITLFVPAMAALGAMPVENIVTALVAIAGIFAVLGLAAVILTPVLPVILGLAGAVALLGVAMLAAGAGLMLFGTGLGLIGAAGAAAIGVLFVAVSTMAMLIPLVMKQIGLGIISLAQVIIQGAPVIAEAIVTVITSSIVKMAEKISAVLELLLDLVSKVLELLLEKVPEFVDAGMKIILGFLQGIADNIQDVVEAAYDIAINFLAGVTEKLPELIQGGVDFIEAFLEGIGEAIPDVVDAAFQMVIDVIGGIADSIETNTPLILEACEDLATAFIDGLKDYLNIDEGNTIAGNLIDGLIQGINNGVTWVVDAVKELGRKVLAGLMSIFKEQSPSQETEWMGENLDKGLINGIVGLAGKVVKAAKDLGSDAINGIRSTMSQISDVIDADLDANPVITPILNLDQIQSGANILGGILANGQSYNLAASQITADRIVSDPNQNGSIQGLNNGQTITNQFNLNGVTVRSEADINKIAEKLYRLQEQAMRARGIRPAYT